LEDVREVTVAEGSTLTWDLYFNKRLQSAALEVVRASGERRGTKAPAPDSPAPVQLVMREDGGRTVANWSVSAASESAKYRVVVQDDAARGLKEAVTLSVKVLPNVPPKIRAIWPKGDARFLSLEELAFEAQASDEGGLKRWGMTLGIAGEEPREMEMGRDAKPGEKVDLRHVIALEERGVKRGDLVSWFFWAEDVQADGSVRRVKTDLLFGRIRSFDEAYRLSESSGGEGGKGGAEPDLAVLQRSVLSATWNLQSKYPKGPETAPAAVNDIAVVQESEQKVLEAVTKALEEAEDAEKEALLRTARDHVQSAVSDLGTARVAEARCSGHTRTACV
jgi:hypothetical protein